MKKIFSFPSVFFLFLVVMILPGCSAIAGIFKAGIWTGFILVAIVLLLIIFLFSRGGKNK